MKSVEDRSIKPLSKSAVSEEMMEQDLFLYDEDSGVVHQLNGGAAMVWLLCDGTRDLHGMAEEIAATGDISAKDVLPDVQETVATFQSLGLLENAPSKE